MSILVGRNGCRDGETKEILRLLLENENMQFTQFFEHQREFLCCACKNRPDFTRNSCFLEGLTVLKANLF